MGIFQSHRDVGDRCATPKSTGCFVFAGHAEFDPAKQQYRITSGGENIWARSDAFHYAWKKVSGDIDLQAEVAFEGGIRETHRKAILMIRQTLEPDSPYVDIAVHGDGLTSLQWRATPGGLTLETRSSVMGLKSGLRGPRRIRIERRSDTFEVFAADEGEPLNSIRALRLVLRDPVYVGLGVASHDAKRLETADFTNVEFRNQPERHIIRSKLSIYDLGTRSVKVIYTADKRFEAPNWSPDGKYLLFNAEGGLWRLPLNGSEAAGQPQKVLQDPDVSFNNDHGISPDGKMLALSGSGGPQQGSAVYVANADGSNLRRLTPKTPSYFHGESPDGKWLAFVGQRDENFDIYRVRSDGGPEERLTSNKGYDDGPEYSPDGKWIYFNSDRNGHFQIWRIPAEGSGDGDAKAEQVLESETPDWFPHVSPDGKRIVFISFPKGTLGHPANRNVELRLIPAPGDRVRPVEATTLVKLFGGQGTMNVNSWGPDSNQFAFVSYEYIVDLSRPPAQ